MKKPTYSDIIWEFFQETGIKGIIILTGARMVDVRIKDLELLKT